jgi:hypothetical protein
LIKTPYSKVTYLQLSCQKFLAGKTDKSIMKSFLALFLLFCFSAQGKLVMNDLGSDQKLHTSTTCKSIWNLPHFLEKPRNQNNIGWCYAYAAADLASSFAGQKLSAAHMAILYNKNRYGGEHRLEKNTTLRSRETTLPESGYESYTLEYALNEGVCLEKDLPSDLIKTTYVNSTKKMTEVQTTSVANRLYNTLHAGEQSKSTVNCPRTGTGIAFPKIPAKNIAEILARVKNDDNNGSQRLSLLARENCKRTGIQLNYSAEDVKYSEQTSSRDLDKLLLSGNIASVAVPFVPTIKNPSNDDLFKFNGDRKALERSDGHHALVLVGRKWDPRTEKCNYLFKNSWGDMTDPSQKTKNGYTIIDEQELNKVQTGGITYIDKKPNWKPGKIPDFLK